MKHQKVNTDNAPSAIGPYSQGILAGNWLFVSGQLGIIPGTGDLAGPDFEKEARQAIENLKQIVIAGEFDLSQVVSVEVFLTDINTFSQFNEIYGEFFSDYKPSRAVVEVSALPKGATIEIKCIASR
jgi:2-iminobutanoate/2-iminopropanoate deaminase